MPTASLLEIGGRRIVVDCGLGVTRGLADAGVELGSIDTVLITHLHSDHVLELGPLLHTAWTSGLSREVEIFGPPGLVACWEGFLASMRYDIDLRIADEGRPDLRRLVILREYGPGAVGVKGLGVTACAVRHPPVEHCHALRIEGPGGAVVFSADTAPHPPLEDFARDAAVLVHEAMLPAGVDRIVGQVGGGAALKAHIERSHSSAAEAGRLAARARVGHLVLHHLIPSDDPSFGEADWLAAAAEEFAGRVTVGRDGLQIAL